MSLGRPSQTREFQIITKPLPDDDQLWAYLYTCTLSKISHGQTWNFWEGDLTVCPISGNWESTSKS